MEDKRITNLVEEAERRKMEILGGGKQPQQPPQPQQPQRHPLCSSAPPHLQAEMLQLALKEYETHRVFKVGDLITWKPGLVNRATPEPGAPAIVMEILPEPLCTGDNPLDIQYREVLDIKVGILNSSDELIMLHVDSKRFQRFGK